LKNVQSEHPSHGKVIFSCFAGPLRTGNGNGLRMLPRL
jgi:hypothetical protein